MRTIIVLTSLIAGAAVFAGLMAWLGSQVRPRRRRGEWLGWAGEPYEGDADGGEDGD